jgi:hypothetical protein
MLTSVDDCSNGGIADAENRRNRAGQTLWILMPALIVAAGPWSVYRACGDGGSDFPMFAAAGRYVVQHGTRHPGSALYRYLPSVDVACIPLTWFPLAWSAAVWYVFNAGCWLLLLRTLRRELLAGHDPKFAAAVTLAAGMLGLPLAIDGFLLGGFHVIMLWLMIVGMWHAIHGRRWQGGLLLGFATWLKLLPVIGIGYLLWRKQWQAAAVATVTCLAIDAGLSLPAFGWQQAGTLHADWFWGDAVGTGDRQLTGETNDDEDRITNQSLFVVLRRVLTNRGGFPELSCGRLSGGEMAVLALSLLALLAGFICLILRANHRHDQPDIGADLALVCLCTLWFSPVIWSYHFIAAVPATAVVLARRKLAWQRWAVIGVWLLGLALFGVDLGRAAGHMLWTTFAIGACLAWSMRSPLAASYISLAPVSRMAELPVEPPVCTGIIIAG